MIYIVIWLRVALDELAMMWMNADATLRAAITSASHRIDQELKANPQEVGESRPKGRRIHFEQPLGILFEVRQGAVRILHVWDARRKR